MANLSETVTPEQMRRVVRCSNFMQKFKMLLWEAAGKEPSVQVENHTRDLLPKESVLDEIASELYDWAKLKE